MKRYMFCSWSALDVHQYVKVGCFRSVDESGHGSLAGEAANDLTIPLSAGLRLAVRLAGRWVPARVESNQRHLSGTGELAVRVYTANDPHKGGFLLVDLQKEPISLDFLGAEDLEAELVRSKVAADGSPRFYTGRLFVAGESGQVLMLERDSKIEIELNTGRRSTWLVKDLLPESGKIVLREPTERNFLDATRIKELAVGSPALSSARILETPRFRFAHETPHERHSGYRRLPFVWLGQMLSNSKGILSVLDMILFRPLSGGLLPDGHPWTTGIDPATGRYVWLDNLIFATPRKEHWDCDVRYQPAPDDVILEKVGNYLSGMARRSASTLEHPFGAPGRMPPAVNYIHGTVSYNAGILMFNDFDEGVFHLSDKRFVAEMQRFARETGREIIIIFRERVHEPRAYAYFAGMIRSVLPWFSNTNGPVRGRTPENEADPFLVDGKVMWGNPAPYPVVNPITGNWIADVYGLAEADDSRDAALLRKLARPPIGRGHYFREQYQGSRQHAQRMERLLAIGTAKRVQARGDNLFFVDQKALEKERELARLAKPEYATVGSDEERQVVVVGGGPAGLAVAQQLKKRGIDALVLERGPAVGHSWHNMPANLSLITRWPLNELPDTPEVIRPTETLVDARRFAKYLENYAAYHQLSVAVGAGVAQVGQGEHGLVVKLSDGRTVRAQEVISAAGYFGNGYIPAIPGFFQSPIPQVHFERYASPAQIAESLGGTGKRILIVGSGLSAGQVMLELEKTGFTVELSARGPVRFGATPRWSLAVQRFLPLVEWIRTLVHGQDGPAPQLRMQGGRTRALIESGRVPVRAEIDRFSRDGVVFKDGSSASYDMVLYCTGFRPQLAHLPGVSFDPETGLPRLREMESVEVPHRHFIGLDGQRTFRSRFLRGIRADAVVLAERIASRLKS